jgi:signal transduction histidine kinase
MFLRKLIRLPKTLAFRLTLWYAGIFVISSFAAFIIIYLLTTSIIWERTDQDLLDEVEEFSSLLELKGINEVKTYIDLETESEGVNKIFFRIITINGDELYLSNVSSWGNIGTSRIALKHLSEGKKYVYETLVIPELQHKIRIIYANIGHGKIFQIGRSLEDDNRFIKVFRDIFSLTLAVIMVFAALIGWFMARRALLGVEEVSRTAIEISKGAFERRVPIKLRGDEIDRLATTFNSMLDRINSLIAGMREITDNIAHDLKSPVTRIRGIAEMTLTTGNSINEFEAMTANTIEECDRLLEMINTMLDISEAQAGAGKLSMSKVDISKIVQKACELFQPIAENKGIIISCKVPEVFHIHGDKQKLQRLVANLLDNALKYTPSEGKVKVSLDGNTENVIISIIDNGIGISEDNLEHIFKRFYRCDRSRSKSGIGLGLSLAIAIAKAHGGNITVSSKPGKGSEFKVILPRSPFSS